MCTHLPRFYTILFITIVLGCIMRRQCSALLGFVSNTAPLLLVVVSSILVRGCNKSEHLPDF